MSLEVISPAQILLIVQTTAINHSNFSFSSFYNSLFWNLEICSNLFLLFFSALYLVHPSILFYSSFCFLLCFLPLYLFTLFSNLTYCFLFKSAVLFFRFSLSMTLSLCSITIQSVLFLLEPSIDTFLLSLFALACFLYTRSFLKGSNGTSSSVFLSFYLFSFPLFSFRSFYASFCSSFCSFLFALVFFSFSVPFSPLFYLLLLFLLFIFFICILTPIFSFIFIHFILFFIIFLVLYFACIAFLLLPTD